MEKSKQERTVSGLSITTEDYDQSSVICRTQLLIFLNTRLLSRLASKQNEDQ